MFDESIIVDIVNAWKDDQNHPGRGRRKRNLPSHDDVRTLVEVAFWASIRTEEGQTVRFSITNLSKEHYREERTLSGVEPLVIEFSKEVGFSVHTLAKLANSFDKENSSLAVGKNEEGDYRIWGTTFFNPSPPSYFEHIPVGIHHDTYFRPDVLSVTVTSPGSLLISRGNSVIGRLEDGSFFRSIPTPLISKALGKYLLGMSQHSSFGAKDEAQTFWLFRESIMAILSYLEENSHGASLVIIPEHGEHLCREYYRSKYQLSGDYQVADLFSALKSVPDEPVKSLVETAYRKAILSRLRAIARLACTDGALIITNTLKALSFGATLTPGKKWEGNVVVGPDGFNERGEDFSYKALGTRHNSMIDVIGECEGTVGFVVSQDGPIRAFVKKDAETILCWPDCRVSMFIE